MLDASSETPPLLVFIAIKACRLSLSELSTINLMIGLKNTARLTF